MYIAGEGSEPKKKHIMKIADAAGISRREAEDILSEVASAVSQWSQFARDTEIRENTIRNIEKVIQRCLKRIT